MPARRKDRAAHCPVRMAASFRDVERGCLLTPVREMDANCTCHQGGGLLLGMQSGMRIGDAGHEEGMRAGMGDVEEG